MAAIFRSEEMYLCEVYMPFESAYSILAMLGEMKMIEFRDLNEENLKLRRFVKESQLCEDLEGKLHYLRLQTKDYNMKVKRNIGNPPAPHPRQMMDLNTPGTADFDLLRKLYHEVKQISYNLSPLERTVKLHIEYQAILKTACSLLFQKVTSLADTELGMDFHVHIIGGVLPKTKWVGFERTLWRICHGNYILQFSDIPSNDVEGRQLFVILVHGNYLKDKILKLCQGFSADMYDIPENRVFCSNLSKRNKSILADLKKAVATSKEHYTKLLSMAATNLCRWLIEIKKMKSIYNTMNKFRLDDSETFLVAECWIPKSRFETVREILINQSLKSGSDIQPLVYRVDSSDEMPPTYYTLNTFTKSFQNIIDAYGIGNYKELNPMPYTVITFPFLFAVMFGDAGHGLILVFIALVMISLEDYFRETKKEIVKMVFEGRYIILLMGLFALYTGFVHNDIFHHSINFGTKWVLPKNVEVLASEHVDVELDPKDSFNGNPYYYGFDPTWLMAENQISFENSFKMKVSVIIGVVHMTFGIILSLFNMIYYKDYISIIGEFIPQLIFFLFLFGYFILLIFIKWATYGTDKGAGRSPSCAPAIIITFVNMVLVHPAEQKPGCDTTMYPYQGTIQTVLLVCAVLCIPMLLLVKPLYYIHQRALAPPRNTPIRHRGSDLSSHSSYSSFEKKKPSKKKMPAGVSDMVITQIIHTVEYVLGTVSYTASYLRLWALSLAHTNLSSVLEMMIVNMAAPMIPKMNIFLGGIFVTITFLIWALFTIGILIIMEGLSAFLHALRLHWMEFQTKFYVGTGYPFTPFSFKNSTREANQELE